MKLTFSDGNFGINAQLNFDEAVTKEFAIENTGTVDAVAKIKWVDLINTYTKGSLTYRLTYSETENGTYTEIVEKTDVPQYTKPTSKVLARNLTIPVDKTYYYKLEITLNYLTNINQDADIDAVFNTKFELVDNSAPELLIDTILAKTNDSTITTYAGGNKGEMYTFDHPTATQTASWSASERRDYRYIGTAPNNWVRFNDEDWRIIGVFTAEKAGGEKEQLVKMRRSGDIGSLPWHTGRINEWSTSSLKTLLNSGDYYNRLNTYANTGLGTTARD